MRLNVCIEIDTEESGLNEDELKDNIVDFTRDLLMCGAAEQDVACTLLEVGYEL